MATQAKFNLACPLLLNQQVAGEQRMVRESAATCGGQNCGAWRLAPKSVFRDARVSGAKHRSAPQSRQIFERKRGAVNRRHPPALLAGKRLQSIEVLLPPELTFRDAHRM
jgi:hypothetical protein